MPIVNVDLTDELTARIDAIAADQTRSRKGQCLEILKMGVEIIEKAKEESESRSVSESTH